MTNPNLVLSGAVLAGAIIIAGTIAAVGSIGRYEIVIPDPTEGRHFMIHDRWAGTLRACRYRGVPGAVPMTLECTGSGVPPITALPD